MTTNSSPAPTSFVGPAAAPTAASGGRPDAHTLQRRILHSLPGGSFELETFIGLVGVEVTDRVETAAVTCGARSRLLLNPEFVAAHCRTDEHLFMLVLHELWHVLLGHTRLYPRPTTAHNIAFDAVINAGLVHRFPDREYRGFFEHLYSADRFPERLLRPPVGWPARPVFTGPGPTGTETLLRALYPVRTAPSAYWADVVALLRDAAVECPDLLGDHTTDDQGYAAVLDDDLVGGPLRDLVDRSPMTFPDGTGVGGGGLLSDRAVGRTGSRSVRREFEEILRRSCRPDPAGTPEPTPEWGSVPSVSVLPHRHDRRRLARARLGVPALLHQRPVPTRVVRPSPPATARVYVDVSGSMSSYLPLLFGPLLTVVQRRLATLWQFSTAVAPLPLAAVRDGVISTTGGTDIDCVLAHALDDPATSCIVLVTDGFVLDPDPQLVAGLRERGVVVEAVVPPDGDPHTLEQIGTVTVLPSIGGGLR